MTLTLYVVDVNTGELIYTNPNEIFWKRVAFQNSRYSKKNKGFYKANFQFPSVASFCNSLLCSYHHSTSSNNPHQ